MHLRRILSALLLSLLALTLFLACTAPAPAPAPPPPPPVYFVNVSSLALREGPTTSARLISVLHFNDEVELMGSLHGWGRVRDIRRNLLGWAALKYLQPAPASRPQFVPPKPQAAPEPPKEEPPKEEPKPEPTPVPKAM